MPTAITTNPVMAGTKRKSAPFKNVHVKDKKPKFEPVMKSTLKSKDKTKPKRAQEIEETSDPDSEDASEDSDSDGGVPLYSAEPEDSEEESDSEATPKAADGLHPERGKAVFVNSNPSF
jgi:pumilio family protein 6